MKIKAVAILFLFCSYSGFSQDFYATGLELNDTAYDAIPKKPRNVSFFDNIGDVANVSLKQYVPTVKNQSSYGTCVGWSTSYYGRTIAEVIHKGYTTQEEIDSQAFHPIYTYLKAASEENKINCQKGAEMNRALRSLKEDGVPLLSEFDAELCADTISEEIDNLAQQNTIQEFRRLITGKETNSLEKIENVKRALYNNNPVIIGYAVEKSFYSAKGVHIPDGLGATGYHAMCVVGFDNEKYGGAFEIVNSWGTNWGNNGYIWVKYDDFAKLTVYGLEIVPKPKPVVEKYLTLGGELNLELRGGDPMKVARGDVKFKKKVLGWQDVVKESDIMAKTVGDYKTLEAYPKETKYQIHAKVDQPSYMYVMFADSDGEHGVLFPNPDNPEIISPYFDNTESELIVPGEDYYFRLNSDVTSDYTIILFSTEEIDITSYNDQLEVLEGDLMDKLYVLFGNELIDKEDIELNDAKMKFSTQFKEGSGSIAMMVLDIKRS